MKFFCLIALVITITSCSKSNNDPKTKSSGPKQSKLLYAEGFSITYQGKNKLVEVKLPYPGAAAGYKYLLVPRGEQSPPDSGDVRIIHIPMQSIVCTSTSHLPLLDYLHESDKLTGFPSTDYISSVNIRKRVDQGFVQDLGIDKGMNLEKLAMLKPDIVMGYTMNSDYGQFRKIEELGVPVVINAEYLEKHPLGRAEWIKFMAAFFNKEKEADSVFQMIEQNYLQTKNKADTTRIKPTVLSGIVYGDAWFLPGGKNYGSRILKDAGCKYLWEDDPSNGFLEVSFESVYAKAHDADLWIGVGSFMKLNDIRSADHRYTRFKPYTKKNIYTYDARKGAKGGSEFLELGYLRPDLILKDLVKIAHPSLLPEHELYFHKKLE